MSWTSYVHSTRQHPSHDEFRSFAEGARLAAGVVQYKPAVERAIHHTGGNAVAQYVWYEKGRDVEGKRPTSITTSAK